MYYLGVIELPASAPDAEAADMAIVSNHTTAIPFSLDGYPVIAVEPTMDGLRMELCAAATDPAWQTSYYRAITVPSAGTSLITFAIGSIQGHVLSVVNPGANAAELRVWGLRK